jgi:hypothetical protein
MAKPRDLPPAKRLAEIEAGRKPPVDEAENARWSRRTSRSALWTSRIALAVSVISAGVASFGVYYQFLRGQSLTANFRVVDHEKIGSNDLDIRVVFINDGPSPAYIDRIFLLQHTGVDAQKNALADQDILQHLMLYDALPLDMREGPTLLKDGTMLSTHSATRIKVNDQESVFGAVLKPDNPTIVFLSFKPTVVDIVAQENITQCLAFFYIDTQGRAQSKVTSRWRRYVPIDSFGNRAPAVGQSPPQGTAQLISKAWRFSN